MQGMLKQSGLDVKGLKKDQYRVGLDVSQTLFDGGAISSQQEVARQEGNVQAAQNEVNLYAVRKRVNEMYFGLLLIDEQIKLAQDLEQLLSTNERKLASMYKGGTASESDYNNVKAERLNTTQQLTNLQAERSTLQRMLSTFCGIAVEAPVKPAPHDALDDTAESHRPELRLADSQLRLADARERQLNAALLPKLSVFASGFYGYPGYNMFEDMMRHDWSWNGMIGARLTWNIGALYTRHNDKAKIQLLRDQAENGREVFLFNNRLEQLQQNENIRRYNALMADDAEIIALRTKVRKAAESKLQHGIIAVNDLVKEINNENAAKVQQRVHEINLLKELYDQKYTINP
jgi:outer membrane protein TolC